MLSRELARAPGDWKCERTKVGPTKEGMNEYGRWLDMGEGKRKSNAACCT